MLKSAKIKNLTVFSESEFNFSPHLNVIIGENSTGKTHLLKVLYSLLAVLFNESMNPFTVTPTKTLLQRRMAEKLFRVFKPDSLGRLVRRRQGRDRCELEFIFSNRLLNSSFSFSTSSKTEVEIIQLPQEWINEPTLFLPPRELLTIYPGFVSVYENHYLEFEETWRDTCLLLGKPALRGPRESRARELLQPLEEIIGGKVVLEKSGRFYLRIPQQGTMEMHLVAEGFRKLAMVAQLVANGSLLDQGYLFWDEPDANLNPKLVKQIAGTILHLCANNVQVFLATHSLFLMRELYIQALGHRSLETKYFGLHHKDGIIEPQSGKTIDDIGQIISLEEELQQSDRYIDLEV
jgi:energy-coupling factor transporter ATP-binding protein EcfA2